MGPEIELTVTIVYEGSKARIATPKEAIPVIRHDLNAMSIPHPKTVNVSVVFPGTVRFFWTALPRSTIQHTLESRIPPHPALRAELEIRDITLRVHDEPGPRPHSGGSMNSNSGQPQMWKPDAGLYAVPMGAALQPVSLENPSVNHGEVNPNTIPMAASTAASGSKTSWNRESQPRIKAEPISDIPIPPPPSSGNTSRQRYDVDEDMEVETPPPSAPTAWPKAVKQNRYPHLRKDSQQSADSHSHSRQPSQSSRRDSESHPPPPPSAYSYSNNNYDARRRDSESHSRYESNSSAYARGPPEDPEVAALRRELREVRRQLQADLAQERTVLESLRELGVDMTADSVEDEVDFVTKARIDHLASELRAERAKRRRVEGVVEDIRRECRAPFVVPALLDAFVEVSRLTAEAMEDGEG